MVPMATARSVGNGVITMSLNSTYRRVVRANCQFVPSRPPRNAPPALLVWRRPRPAPSSPPLASTLDRLGCSKPTRRMSPGQRASSQRPRRSPRGRHHPARPSTGAQPRRYEGARARRPRAPRPRPSADPKRERLPGRTRGPLDPQCDKTQPYRRSSPPRRPIESVGPPRPHHPPP